MPRNYKHKPGSKSYRRYREQDVAAAVSAINEDMSYRKAEDKFNIPKSVLYRRVKYPY